MKTMKMAMMPLLPGLLLIQAVAPGGAESLSAQASAREVAARTAPAVVAIRALVDGEEVSTGSGFVIRSDGVVVTNFHVIEPARSLEVELATGEVFGDVYVLGTDERRDLAILKLPTTRLPALEPGDANALAVGDPVYVMGNPLGLDRTFSDGLVSARRVIDGVAYVQISAPISAGSSGGPVLDGGGRVIGVAAATLADGQNLNLAVPMSYAEGILSLAGAPEPFEVVAARWAASAEAADTAVGELLPTAREELEEWESVVVEQLEGVAAIVAGEGYMPVEDPYFDLLAPDSIHSAAGDLEPGDYRAVAVCDNDCSDLDLMVTDEAGDVLGLDVLEDDVPVVDFTTSGGRTSFSVKMVLCSTEVCYYGLQLYRKK